MRNPLRRSPAAWAACTLLAAAAACDNPADTSSAHPEGIAVISGATGTDTVDAVLAAPLVVEVRDEKGRPVRGAEIIFAGPFTNEPMAPPRVRVASAGSGEPSSFGHGVQTITDGTGRAAVHVRLGVVAGPVQVSISVPAEQYQQTATYMVAPGTGVQIVAEPRDTALLAGASYNLRLALTDRWKNPTGTVPTVSAVNPGTATLAGSTVRGVSVGRARFTVQAGALTAEVLASVVPAGTLMAMRPEGVFQFATDGSGMRRVYASNGGNLPRWLPDGQRFVFTEGQRLRLVQADGTSRALVNGSTTYLEFGAHPSRDGQWVYFGSNPEPSSPGRPARVRPDGSGAEIIPGYNLAEGSAGYPSPSPDGTRVVYFNAAAPSLRIVNMVTGEVVASNIPGYVPEWSHGNLIAYLSTADVGGGRIMLMSGTGTGVRVLVNQSVYGIGMDWAPDDRWIVAGNGATRRLELVEVATGLVLPLGYTTGMSQPAWKP